VFRFTVLLLMRDVYGIVAWMMAPSLVPFSRCVWPKAGGGAVVLYASPGLGNGDELLGPEHGGSNEHGD
jgi:hypothetical protein